MVCVEVGRGQGESVRECMCGSEGVDSRPAVSVCVVEVLVCQVLKCLALLLSCCNSKNHFPCLRACMYVDK